MKVLVKVLEAMLPIVGVFVKCSVAGAGWCVLDHWVERMHKKEKKRDATTREVLADSVVSAAAAPFAAAVFFLSLDALMRGMVIVLSRLEDEKYNYS